MWGFLDKTKGQNSLVPDWLDHLFGYQASDLELPGLISSWTNIQGQQRTEENAFVLKLVRLSSVLVLINCVVTLILFHETGLQICD